ncbi:citrate lyase subunit alpha [Escherichia coli]
MQTGTGGASLAVTRFLEDKMRSRDIRADFTLAVSARRRSLTCTKRF